MESYYNPLAEYECGIDEAGRGSLAGPLFTAAVVLPKDFKNDVINDSKKLSAKKREQMVPIIKEQAIAYAIDMASVEEIDEHNVLQATMMSMHRCLDKINESINVTFIIVDGDTFNPYKLTASSHIIKGDETYYSIAAASILAKHYRDQYMKVIHELHPEFGWDSNFGYGTKKHFELIQNGRYSKMFHRRSFNPLKTALLSGI